ncbi:MAG TPA: hypothetical protein VLV86_06055 [Vicinamibacterales bacterium]|nr:hypothetical protein [Vicinamibacterales bacterium]
MSVREAIAPSDSRGGFSLFADDAFEGIDQVCEPLLAGYGFDTTLVGIRGFGARTVGEHNAIKSRGSLK